MLGSGSSLDSPYPAMCVLGAFSASCSARQKCALSPCTGAPRAASGKEKVGPMSNISRKYTVALHNHCALRNALFYFRLLLSSILLPLQPLIGVLIQNSTRTKQSSSRGTQLIHSLGCFPSIFCFTALSSLPLVEKEPSAPGDDVHLRF